MNNNTNNNNNNNNKEQAVPGDPSPYLDGSPDTASSLRCRRWLETRLWFSCGGTPPNTTQQAQLIQHPLQTKQTVFILRPSGSQELEIKTVCLHSCGGSGKSNGIANGFYFEALRLQGARNKNCLPRILSGVAFLHGSEAAGLANSMK